MEQVEKAVAGDVKVKDRDGNVLDDLREWVKRRINSAKKMLDDCERVALRLDAKYGEDATKIRQRVSQVRAWVEKIEKGVQSYAKRKKVEQPTKSVGEKVYDKDGTLIYWMG